MRNYTFLLILLAVSLLAFGCSDFSSSPKDEEATFEKEFMSDGQGAITYSIELDTSYYDESSDETFFSYIVVSNPGGGPAISHWVIEFDEDCGSADAIAGSNDPLVEWNNEDPTTGVRGVKFDTGYDDEEVRTVTLSLSGYWDTADVVIAVKSGNGFVLGSTEGPICGDGGDGGGGGGGGDDDPTYTLSGTVYYDVNMNGFQDAGEPGIEGVEVTLANGGTVISGPDGYYEYLELLPGEYNVSVGEHNNREHTTPSSVDFTIVDANVIVDFGFEPYHIDGYVFFDINGNGVQDAGEPGIEGIAVAASDGQTFSTDGDGYYYFGGLLPGSYDVTSEEIDGYLNTTDLFVSVEIVNDDGSVNFGYELDFESLCGQVADGYTIGFWKNNIKKAMQGKTKGVQIPGDTIIEYLGNVSTFAMSPFTYSSLNEAFNTLSSTSSDPADLLAKQLLGSEFNYANGAYIGGNELVTWGFLYYGEFLLVNSGDYSGEELLEAKDWYDAYNNSHGGEFYGPTCQ